MLETVAIRWWLAAVLVISAALLPHAFDDPFQRVPHYVCVATSSNSFLCNLQ